MFLQPREDAAVKLTQGTGLDAFRKDGTNACGCGCTIVAQIPGGKIGRDASLTFVEKFRMNISKTFRANAQVFDVVGEDGIGLEQDDLEATEGVRKNGFASEVAPDFGEGVAIAHEGGKTRADLAFGVFAQGEREDFFLADADELPEVGASRFDEGSDLGLKFGVRSARCGNEWKDRAEKKVVALFDFSKRDSGKNEEECSQKVERAGFPRQRRSQQDNGKHSHPKRPTHRARGHGEEDEAENEREKFPLRLLPISERSPTDHKAEGNEQRIRDHDVLPKGEQRIESVNEGDGNEEPAPLGDEAADDGGERKDGQPANEMLKERTGKARAKRAEGRKKL